VVGVSPPQAICRVEVTGQHFTVTVVAVVVVLVDDDIQIYCDTSKFN